MSLKEYISPEFQWMSVSLIEDALTPSNPQYPEDGGDGDFDTDEEAGEEDMNEATSPSLDWGNDWENW